MHWACEKITASDTIPDTVLLEGLLDKVCVHWCQIEILVYIVTQLLLFYYVSMFYTIAYSFCRSSG